MRTKTVSERDAETTLPSKKPPAPNVERGSLLPQRFPDCEQIIQLFVVARSFARRCATESKRYSRIFRANSSFGAQRLA
jgi:hypothetical protein